MNGSLFDQLTRRAQFRHSRRASLGLLSTLGVTALGASRGAEGKKRKKKKKQKITICDQGQTLSVKKRGWQGRHPGATQGACAAGECATCSADMCFAESVNPDNSQPLAFACCPAAQLCLSTTPPYPDQCCYPDETCQPSLATTDPEKGTICCRQCNGACCNTFEECVAGFCEPQQTARLPRTRRP